MNWSNLATIVLSGLLAICAAMASAWFAHWLGRKQTRLEIERLQLENDQFRKNIKDTLRYQVGDSESVVLYDASGGFSRFDFSFEPRDAAEGRLTFADGETKDEILIVERSNTQGMVMLKLNSYSIRGSRATRLPSIVAGAKRRLRAEMEVRVLGGAHTMLLAIKEEGSAPGHHLAEWRERVESDAWKPVDAYFEFPAVNETYLRILDRSVAKAPSSLQIRRLVLTERIS